ncbi:probable G-protein coupled receptor AH9.1 [Amphibalanus amphitrite]|uniref:probable G-protein coupled receptor AH9.1 n=1 Tax=Amphibalanus amphitrite TaxID=1232801 RepID=UPI001C928850|nr:probable G-protein coupled receptor AH9.1 [Amphibalanus amphitrite]
MDHPYLNVSDAEFTRRLHHVTYGVVAPLLVTSGIVGNLVFLPCLVAPQRWGVTRLFLVVLSSVDMSIMAGLIPTLVRLAAPTETIDTEPLATYAAHVEQWLLTTTMCASVGVVLVLTVDRYTSVCRYVEFQRTQRREQARRRLVAVGVVSVVVSLPCLFNSSTKEVAGGWAVDHHRTGGWKGYIIFSEVVTRLAPMLAGLLLNWRIALGFREMVARAEGRRPPGPGQQRGVSVASMPSMAAMEERAVSEERQLIWLVVAIMVGLVLGMTPAAVTSCCLLYADRPSRALDVATALANLLEIANFSANYLFYLIFNKRLRKSLIDFYRNLFAAPEKPVTIVNG